MNRQHKPTKILNKEDTERSNGDWLAIFTGGSYEVPYTEVDCGVSSRDTIERPSRAGAIFIERVTDKNSKWKNQNSSLMT
jgi:hypothetical protein